MWRLLFFISFCVVSNLSAENRWETVTEDLEIGRLTVDKDSFFSSELLFVRTSLSKYRLTVLRAVSFGQTTTSAKALAYKSNSVLTINANFFDENEQPLGLVVSQGIQQQKLHKGGNTLTGVFFITRSDLGIVSRADYKSELAIEAVQAGPRLLSNGKKIKGLSKKQLQSRRAGVCIDKEKRVVFFISTGLFGLTLQKLQNILLQPEVACVDALNLDGGGSAQLFLDTEHAGEEAKIGNIVVHGSDPVPVMLALRQR